MPDEVWAGLELAIKVHAGYVCSPFTPKDWAEQAAKKIGINKEDVKMYKTSQLSVIFPSDN